MEDELIQKVEELCKVLKQTKITRCVFDMADNIDTMDAEQQQEMFSWTMTAITRLIIEGFITVTPEGMEAHDKRGA